jgi:hypothetical protein
MSSLRPIPRCRVATRQLGSHQRGVVTVAAAALSALAMLATLSAWPASVAQAAKSGSCAGFTVRLGGHPYSGDQHRVIQPRRVGKAITVTGRYVWFRVVPSTFEVRDYTLTGADSPDAGKNLPLNRPSVVFTRKVPLHGKTLTSGLSLDISNEGVVLERSGGGQDMKVQAKNCPQGGLFQLEPEPGTRERNSLGRDYRFTRTQPGGPLCVTHVSGRFSAYDSPELASLLANTARRSTWRVASGGRVGFVVGEDAAEGGCAPRS